MTKQKIYRSFMEGRDCSHNHTTVLSAARCGLDRIVYPFDRNWPVVLELIGGSRYKELPVKEEMKADAFIGPKITWLENKVAKNYKRCFEAR